MTRLRAARFMDKRPVASIIIASNISQATRDFIENTVRHAPVLCETVVVRNKKPQGFTKIANQGALKARGEFLCFLKDGCPVRSKWLETLLAFAEKSGVGAVRSDIQSGDCLLIPRVAMSKVGLFDEQFSFDAACVDYALRLRLKGYRWISKDPLSVYLKSLSRSVKKRLIKKWRILMNKKLSNGSALLAAARRKSSRVMTGTESRFGTRRLLRAGMAILLPKNGTRIQAVVRFSDFEMFSLDPLSQKIWKALSGFGQPRESSTRGTKQRIEAFIHHGLVARSRPLKSRHRRLVTVMMAAHNAERWIAEAIESVLAQTFSDFELIIVNDGSTDGTIQIARGYARHPQVLLLQNTRQLGISATRNRILSLARGKYIAICDADDVMRSTLLERFVGVLTGRPEVGWVYADVLTIDALGHRLNILPALPMDGYREFQRNVVGHCGALIRRDAMLKVGGYDESLTSSDDYDIALRISKHTRMLALSGEIHYLWRRHPESNSQNDSPNPWAKYEFRQVVANGLRHQRSQARNSGVTRYLS